jgi:hypothetical protein
MSTQDPGQQEQEPKKSPFEVAYRAYLAGLKAYWAALDVEAIDFNHPQATQFHVPFSTCTPCQITSTCTPCQVGITCSRCQKCTVINLNVLCLPCLQTIGTVGTSGSMSGCLGTSGTFGQKPGP